MAENEDGQEKTEQPTGRRREKAASEGNLPRSRELATAAVFGTAVIGLMAGGPLFARAATGWMRHALTPDPALLDEPGRLFGHMGMLLMKLMVVALPLVGLSVLACLIAPALMGSLQFSGKALTPKFDRLDPMAGLKRVYSADGLAELAKSLLRVALLGTACGMVLANGFDVLRGMPGQSLEEAARTGLHFAGRLLGAAALALLLLAAIDAPYQKWNWTRKLKMTRQEVRDEMKDTDGNPQIKGRIRQMQMQMSQRRMMEAVPTADVVVVNPTHYAVALKYDGGTMGAPRVVAKGVDELALRIRAVAGEHRITLVEAPPLARALYREGEIGMEIPVRLYAAVAQVLSYVYQLRTWRPGNGRPPQLGQVAVDEFPPGKRP